MKIYTHGSKIGNDEIEVEANPKLFKKSVFGKQITTHEVVKEQGKLIAKKLNKKNGNIKTTLHSTKKKNIDDAINKLSNREKRKLKRHK